MSEIENNDVPKNEYKGNNIPFIIIFVWTILAIWGIYYLVSFSFSDLKNWL